MAVLIDPPAWPAHGTLWSHLVSDNDYAELHAFARQLGVPRRGFDLDHYDVPASKYDEAVARGARPVTAKDVVHALRESGLRVRQLERAAIRPQRRREYLLSEWSSLGDSLGTQHKTTHDTNWTSLGTGLITRWNEPHRTYHDERHLEDVLLALDQLAVRGERITQASLLAAWFHDAVYTGAAGAQAGADETASARLAASALADLGVVPSLVRRVSELVLATAPGAVADREPDLAHLLDADLAIFGASPARYEQYSLAVRSEYAHVPDADFAAGRAQILDGYLTQPTIYRSDTARALWEARARENVSREITLLHG